MPSMPNALFYLVYAIMNLIFLVKYAFFIVSSLFFYSKLCESSIVLLKDCMLAQHINLLLH